MPPENQQCSLICNEFLLATVLITIEQVDGHPATCCGVRAQPASVRTRDRARRSAYKSLHFPGLLDPRPPALAKQGSSWRVAGRRRVVSSARDASLEPRTQRGLVVRGGEQVLAALGVLDERARASVYGWVLAADVLSVKQQVRGLADRGLVEIAGREDRAELSAWEGTVVLWAARLSPAGHDLLLYARTRPRPGNAVEEPDAGRRLVKLMPSQMAARVCSTSPTRHRAARAADAAPPPPRSRSASEPRPVPPAPAAAEHPPTQGGSP